MLNANQFRTKSVSDPAFDQHLTSRVSPTKKSQSPTKKSPTKKSQSPTKEDIPDGNLSMIRKTSALKNDRFEYSTFSPAEGPGAALLSTKPKLRKKNKKTSHSASEREGSKNRQGVPRNENGKIKKSSSALNVSALPPSEPPKKSTSMKKSKSVSFRMDLCENIPYNPPSQQESGSDTQSVDEWEQWYRKHSKELAQGLEIGKDESPPSSPPRWVGCQRCIRCGSKFISVIRRPLDILFGSTLPNLDVPQWERWYVYTYLMSIVYLVLFTAVAYICVTTFFCFTPTDQKLLFALPLLAITLNLGDLFLSIKLSQQALGPMVCSILLGHNILSVLIGLPFPWLIHNIFSSESFIPSNNSNLFFWSTSSAVVLLFVLIWFGGRWKLTTIKAGMFTMAYFTYLTYVFLISTQ